MNWLEKALNDRAAKQPAGSVAVNNLAAVQPRVVEIKKQLWADLSAAASYRDANLSATGLGAKRTEMARAARERAASEVGSVRVSLERDVATIADWASSVRPKVGSEPADLMRLQISWDRARMLLEAGRSMPEVLAGADVETALAIGEWGPTWLRAQNKTPPTLGMSRREPDTDRLRRAVDDRLAELSGADVAAAIAAAREAERVTAAFEPNAAHLEGRTPASSPLQAALESHYAAKAVDAPVDDDAVSDDVA